MDTFSFDVELSQQTITNNDGNFNFETMAKSNDANIQTVILADKEGLALGWANWYLTKDLDVQITLGRPMVLAGRVVDESGEPVNNAQVSISVMTMAGDDEPRYIAGRISEKLFSCRTNAAGKFQFERIPPDAAAEFIAAIPRGCNCNFMSAGKILRLLCRSKRKLRAWLWKRIPANRLRV